MTRITALAAYTLATRAFGILVLTASVGCVPYYLVKSRELEHLAFEGAAVSAFMVLVGLLAWIIIAAKCCNELAQDILDVMARWQGAKARREARTRLTLLVQTHPAAETQRTTPRKRIRLVAASNRRAP